jgi:hypothetical protein
VIGRASGPPLTRSSLDGRPGFGGMLWTISVPGRGPFRSSTHLRHVPRSVVGWRTQALNVSDSELAAFGLCSHGTCRADTWWTENKDMDVLASGHGRPMRRTYVEPEEWEEDRTGRARARPCFPILFFGKPPMVAGGSRGTARRSILVRGGSFRLSQGWDRTVATKVYTYDIHGSVPFPSLQDGQ